MITKHEMGKDNQPFYTTDKFWDCECERNYIHKKGVSSHCNKCNTHEEDQPDSRVDEVIKAWVEAADWLLISEMDLVL